MNIALVFCQRDSLFGEFRVGALANIESNPPLGLASIGTVGTERGHNVKIFDQLLKKQTNNELINAIIAFKPDMVGFSCSSLNIINSIECAEKIKQLINVPVFAGGIHITLEAENVHNKDLFDFLMLGEGEDTFDAVLDAFETEKNIYDLKVPGFWSKISDQHNDIAVLCNIDRPIMNRSILDINDYKNKGALLDETPCYSLFSSRGCPYYCKFCSKPAYFKNYRTVSIDKVFEEIHNLIDEFGAKSISFREDNFTADKGRLRIFCQRMIDEFNGEFFWECESRADMPTELLELMYRAGCRGIWCGVETIVPKWSKWINKQLERSSVEKFYKDCFNIGIKTGALFMFGFPDQTMSEIEEDINFALSLPTVFSAFQCLTIFPGSPLADYYNIHSELKHPITDCVSLALIRGKNCKDMIDLEQYINTKIRCSRKY